MAKKKKRTVKENKPRCKSCGIYLVPIERRPTLCTEPYMEGECSLYKSVLDTFSTKQAIRFSKDVWGIVVSEDTIRRWCTQYGVGYQIPAGAWGRYRIDPFKLRGLLSGKEEGD
ncbi:hypothetical protein LCGC14_0957440 [marine sediment metagenome]|uniref:Uncharacterized protein n=1 Tax=marine sediment metagenome TaxID=412755 RepID=A0A0F9NFC9_9ZZZZ